MLGSGITRPAPCARPTFLVIRTGNVCHLYVVRQGSRSYLSHRNPRMGSDGVVMDPRALLRSRAMITITTKKETSENVPSLCTFFPLPSLTIHARDFLIFSHIPSLACELLHDLPVFLVMFPARNLCIPLVQWPNIYQSTIMYR